MNSLISAYVLHARPYRDSSLLLELLCAEHGRCGAVLRGARGRKGRGAASWQPFMPLWVSLGGRGELRNVLQGEPRATPPLLGGTALYSGFYLNELLVRLLQRDEPQPLLYPAYESSLDALAAGVEADIALRYFELQLLEVLGYGLSLAEAADGPVRASAWYRFVPGQGLLLSPPEPGALEGAGLCEFRERVYSDRARRTLKHLCRQALQPLLGERPLVSRQLFGSQSSQC